MKDSKHLLLWLQSEVYLAADRKSSGSANSTELMTLVEAKRKAKTE